MQEENYVDNKFEGLFKTYFDDGSIQQEGLYKDNMMTGIWKNYFQEPKNKVKEEITLKDNHISGMYKEYYPNGNIYAVGNKKEILDDMDVFDGEVTLFDSLENNKPIRKLIFENGKQISKEDI
jgi:antitoxin component YwqK of YwqJK toxin-antitoxin module